jgi:eukaryotic-like serine/threonine-protein kinase
MRPIAEGIVIKNKYRLERQIAGGGMGALWLAFDLTLMRHVAVKFIRAYASTSSHLSARFEREARSAAQIRSPHVVATYDYGIDRGCAFIVMEHLEGEDLSSRLEREGKLPVHQTLMIFRQITKALDAVHAAGIIHRDLKPANIFLAVEGGEDVVKVLDFGVAKAAMSGTIDKLTETGMVLGTPRYMSPEQTKGAKLVDHRSDLWSTAVIVYRALTGINPFNGVSTSDIIDSICRKPITKASELAPELPPAIDLFFERALSRNPDDRFQSGKEMADVLFNIMREPIPESARLLPVEPNIPAVAQREANMPDLLQPDQKTLIGIQRLAAAPRGDGANSGRAEHENVEPRQVDPSTGMLAPTFVMHLPPQSARGDVGGVAPMSVRASNPLIEEPFSDKNLLPPFRQSKLLWFVLAAIAIAVIGLSVAAKTSCALGIGQCDGTRGSIRG